MIITPGVTGDNDELYMIQAYNVARKSNYKCVCVNFRDGSGVELTVKNLVK